MQVYNENIIHSFNIFTLKAWCSISFQSHPDSALKLNQTQVNFKVNFTISHQQELVVQGKNCVLYKACSVYCTSVSCVLYKVCSMYCTRYAVCIIVIHGVLCDFYIKSSVKTEDFDIKSDLIKSNINLYLIIVVVVIFY